MSQRKIVVTVVLAILFAVGAFAIGGKSFRGHSTDGFITQDSVQKREEPSTLVHSGARTLVPTSAL